MCQGEFLLHLIDLNISLLHNLAMRKQTINSSGLFNYPSFQKGLSRVFDLFGNIDIYNYSDSDDEADYNALKSDWKLVGCDIKNAIKNYGSISR